MSVVGDLLKNLTGFESERGKKLKYATDVAIRRILEGMGLNIKAETTPEQIFRQMKLMSITVKHIIDKPGEDPTPGIPTGYFFYKGKKLVYFLREPYFEGGEIVIEKGRVMA